ncbi:unnamed protein product [Brachionus calyciflorus]|uniref:EGF-like domain-containing protein n=1 Tax=Brachionus calyciflorus TaxID=104777 RepID=A0A814DVN5_9BILA|nr:unnamed protein product [Brachionus calyciflorus]
MEEKRSLSGLNQLLDKVDQAEVYEYVIDDKKKSKKQKGRLFSDKFSLSRCFFALFTNICILVISSFVLFWIFIWITGSNNKLYGNHCNSDKDCESNFNLRCQFGFCNCTSDYYYKSEIAGCVVKSMYNDGCSIDYHCFGGQICSNNFCKCSNERFWNTTTSNCEERVSYGEYCNNNNECTNGANMICLNNKCTCSDPNVYYWNGTYCAPVQTFLGNCSSNSSCKPSSKLICYLNEYYPNKCACPTNFYWNSTAQICTQMKNINETCVTSVECMSKTNLYCALQSGSYICTCPTNYFWSTNSSSCIKKATFGQNCTDICDDTVRLVCNSANYCVCNSTRFWNGTYCADDYTSGLNCDNNFDCDSTVGLICDTTYKRCVCASTHYWKTSVNTCTLKLINGSFCGRDIECQTQNGLSCAANNRCACPTNYFWNVNVCTMRYDPNIFCSNTYECKDYAGLVCRNSNGISSYSCQCAYWEYWTGAVCTTKLSVGAACSVDYQCRHYLGLVCAGTCICQYTHYWTGTICALKKTYNVACGSHLECQDYLALSCLSSKCQCSKMMYWDDIYGAGCLFKKTNNTACNGTNPQCQDYAGLSCVGNICQCTYPEYWVTNKCQKPAGINQYCDGTTYKCERGLVCLIDQNNLQVCSCPPTQHYTVNGCVDFRTYGETCSFWNNPCDDALRLYCPVSPSNCNCPLTSVALKCDCKDIYYWDGGKCADRSQFGGPCEFNYQCVKNKNLVCHPGSGQCLCEDIYFQFYNGASCVSCPAGQRSNPGFYTSCVAY